MINLIQLGGQLSQLSQISGTNQKLETLAHLESEELKTVLDLAYNPYIKFNIVNLQNDILQYWINEYSNQTKEYITFEDLKDYFLNYLANRRITGKAAQHLVCELYVLTPEEFKPFFLGILDKDLKIGIGIKSINKVFKNLISTFEVPLCERFKKIKLNVLEYPLYVEPKKDGIRTISKIIPRDDDYEIELISRGGLTFNGFDTIERELRELAFHNELDHSIIMDGEIKDRAFQNTMENARRIHDQDTSNAVYTIWDTINLGDFIARRPSKMNLEIRKELLHMYFCGLKAPHLVEIEYKEVETWNHILELFDYYFDMQGEEGIIVKDPLSPYFYKRTKDWFKVKIQDVRKAAAEYSVQLLSMELGDPGKRFQNTLGRFKYWGKAEFEGKQVEIQGYVGSGFTDAQRKEFWEREYELVLKIFDVTAQEVSLNKNGEYSLRFPIFKSFRPDLSIDDL